MIPRPDNRRHYNSRLDNLISWLAASVIVTAGVIYSLKLQEDRGKPRGRIGCALAGCHPRRYQYGRGGATAGDPNHALTAGRARRSGGVEAQKMIAPLLCDQAQVLEAQANRTRFRKQIDIRTFAYHVG